MKPKDKLEKVEVPPKGPATNLRPAGAHKNRRTQARREIKIALRKEGDLPFSRGRGDRSTQRGAGG